ncbi:hypothetical protein BDV09DRAFT_24025 [Aspergillus tetrazonus]
MFKVQNTCADPAILTIPRILSAGSPSLRIAAFHSCFCTTSMRIMAWRKVLRIIDMATSTFAVATTFGGLRYVSRARRRLGHQYCPNQRHCVICINAFGSYAQRPHQVCLSQQRKQP